MMPHHLCPGTILKNEYRIGEVIGEGGFGITYKGQNLTLDVPVAIKEFFPVGFVNRNNRISQNIEVVNDAKKEFVKKGKRRFLEEARNVARFSGEKNIVNVSAFFEENDTAYIVMEYLDGMTLSQNLERFGRWDADEIIERMLPIMEALNRMHHDQVIHRDISPDNIMLLKTGTLKLMDFGSARVYTDSDRDMSVTIRNGYAPVEQYSKKGRQGPWTDVYGLCATIYTCITNVKPESAPDRMEQDDLVPPSALGITIAPALERVLMYGMAVRKEDRCRNMEELGRQFTQALAEHKTAAQAKPAAGKPFAGQQMPGASSMQPGSMPQIQPGGMQQVSRAMPYTGQQITGGPYTGQQITGVSYMDSLRTGMPQSPAGQASVQGKLQKPLSVISIIAAALALLLCILTVSGHPVGRAAKELEVPDVRGMMAEKAEDRLERENLEPEIVYVESVTQTEGSVLAQSPGGGTYRYEKGRQGGNQDDDTVLTSRKVILYIVKN